MILFCLQGNGQHPPHRSGPERDKRSRFLHSIQGTEVTTISPTVPDFKIVWKNLRLKFKETLLSD